MYHKGGFTDTKLNWTGLDSISENVYSNGTVQSSRRYELN